MAFLFGVISALFFSAIGFFVVYFNRESVRNEDLKKQLKKEKDRRDHITSLSSITKPKTNIEKRTLTMEEILQDMGFQTDAAKPKRPVVVAGEMIQGQLPGEDADTARRRMRAEADRKKQQEDEERNRNRGEDILNSLLAGSTYDSGSSSYDTGSSDSSSSYDSGCSDSGSGDSGGGDCGGGDF